MLKQTQMNLQDTFLNQARKENVGVTVYLVNGHQLRGNVRGFDSFTILLDTPGKPAQLVYKHAVTSVVPVRPINLPYQEAARESGAAPAAAPAPVSNGAALSETSVQEEPHPV